MHNTVCHIPVFFVFLGGFLHCSTHIHDQLSARSIPTAISPDHDHFTKHSVSQDWLFMDSIFRIQIQSVPLEIGDMHLSYSLLCPAWLRTRSVLWMWHKDFELQWYIPPPDGVSQRCHHFALDKERRCIHVLPALSIFINTSNSHPLKTPTEINWGDSWWHGRLPGDSAQPAGLRKFVALVVVDSLCGFGCASNSPRFSLALTYASWHEFESLVLGSNTKWWWNWRVALLFFWESFKWHWEDILHPQE